VTAVARGVAETIHQYGEYLCPPGADGLIRPPAWWPEDVVFIPPQAHANSLLDALTTATEPH
jgi:hypothetical protein